MSVDLRRRASVLLGLFLLSGCAGVRLGDAPLTIATAWPETERAELAREFRRWLAGKEGSNDIEVRIDWVVLQPGDDFERLVVSHGKSLDGRAHPVDVALGGPAWTYTDLAIRGRLGPSGRPGEPLWCVARRGTIGWAQDPRVETGVPAFDDPRRDALTLAWAEGVLRESTWAEGYARLIQTAARAPLICRHGGAARAAVERGEAALTPALPFSDGGSLRFRPGDSGARWVEGVAVIAGGDNPTAAQRFVAFLATRGQAESPEAEDWADPTAAGLLADLLGATLVDAQNELPGAWAACERAGSPPMLRRHLAEAPPWPPASVAKLLHTEGAGPLVTTLAEQITPDADTRAWLVRSWLAPDRPIEGSLLLQLSTAVDGRLAREPRFRAWLRGEWTAWARQRYRRVERQASRPASVLSQSRGQRTSPSK
jgi:hypothetical protein